MAATQHMARRTVLSAGLAAAALAPSDSAGAEPVGVAAARDALGRLFGDRLAGADLTLEPQGPRRRPWYAVEVRAGRVSISGDSPVALVRGGYACLRQAGLAHVSWEGVRVDRRAPLPDRPRARVDAAFGRRAYLNPCTFGYTTPWWDWSRWSREIDWMAAHGIDTPLALEGQEHVWRALWGDVGLGGAELDHYFSGPPFAPWQRMGNIEGYRAPLPAGWIARKKALQIRILQRMRALGMTPILPAFAGYVPTAIADRHPEARIHRMRPWEGFRETCWLDPLDPLFAELAGRFLSRYAATYGAGDYYLADAFNEMTPPLRDPAPGGGPLGQKDTYADAAGGAGADPNAGVDPALKARRLAAYGRAIHESIRQVQPRAVWVMQGWLFGADARFWDSPAISAFLSGAPDDGLMILDIGNDRYPNVWRRAQGYGGKAWVYGYVHNYGGSNPVYGDLDFYRRDLAAMVKAPAAGRLAGVGVFPEGLHNSSIVYDAVYDLAWSAGEASLGDWLSSYARARYGRTTPALDRALGQLVKAAYSTRYWTPRWWNGEAGAYLLFKRPTVAVVDFPGHPGDPVKLEAAVRALAAMAPDFADERLFMLDLVDAARHLVSLRIDALLQASVAAYRRGDAAAGDRAQRAMRDLVLGVDAMLGVQPDSLSTWIDDARRYADTPDEARANVTNAKAQITIWGGGGGLDDYASKAWQGLYRHYYLPRWSRFLRALRAAGTGPFDEARAWHGLAAWEQAWVAADTPYRRAAPSNPIATVRSVIAGLGRG